MFTLNNIKNLCKKLDDPQDKLKFVHIAGTNGKGSTSAFIASVLKEAGLKTGVYSSPAVFKEEEIIRINGRNIAKKAYRDKMERIDELCTELCAEGKADPSLFERQTALAFWHFLEEGCDIVVLEAGMGGENDATNIVKNTLVSVFTPVSYDHTEYLGNSLHNIAKNKAGIMKKGAAAISGMQLPEALSALHEKADELGLRLDILKKEDLSFNESRKTGEQEFEYDLHKYKITLNGTHQLYNAALAVMAVKALSEKGVVIPGKAVENGLHKTKWCGRFEVIASKPLIIIDGAHNEGGAKVLKDSVLRYLSRKKLVGIAGMLKDKDHEAVLCKLAPLCGMLFTVSTQGQRGYSASELAETASLYNKNVTSIGGIEEAVELARMTAGSSGAILIFGSLSILGAAKKYCKSC